MRNTSQLKPGLDPVDCAIAARLQQNARTTNVEIARELGMAPSAILERIRKLERRGVIEAYTARLNPRALGLGLTAFVLVRSSEPVGHGGVGAALARLPEVLEVHHVAGEDCYLLKLRVADPEELSRVLRERFSRLKGVRSTRSTIVLTTVKESSALPIPAGPARRRHGA